MAKRVTHELAQVEYKDSATRKRVTHELAQAEYEISLNNKRVTSTNAQLEYVSSNNLIRVTQILVQAEIVYIPVVVNLTTASLNSLGVNIITSFPQEIILSTASIVSSGITSSLVTGESIINLNTSLLSSSGIQSDITTGSVSINLVTSSINTTGNIIGILNESPEQVQVSWAKVSIPESINKVIYLDSATLYSNGQISNVSLGQTIIILDVANIQALALTSSFVLGGTSILLDTATSIAGGQHIYIGEIPIVLFTMEWQMMG